MLAKFGLKAFVTLLFFILVTPFSYKDGAYFIALPATFLVTCFPMSLFANLFNKLNLVYSALATFPLCL